VDGGFKLRVEKVVLYRLQGNHILMYKYLSALPIKLYWLSVDCPFKKQDEKWSPF
jgi:hypothetical protein